MAMQFIGDAISLEIGQQPAVLGVVLLDEERLLATIAPLGRMMWQCGDDDPRSSSHGVRF